MSATRESLTRVSRCVVKIGSALLTNNGQGLDSAAIGDWVAQIAQLRAAGMEIVLVSSGAVAAGMQRLGYKTRPHALHELQAMAAVGQMGLVQVYESAFQRHGLHTAQVLLTHDDLANRERYLNARSTLRTLLALGVIPVVNENDTVATEEIRFGDGGALGRGGMRTKLLAAAKAARSGAATVIAWGRETNVLTRLLVGEHLGTYLKPAEGRVAARKRWSST